MPPPTAFPRFTRRPRAWVLIAGVLILAGAGYALWPKTEKQAAVAPGKGSGGPVAVEAVRVVAEPLQVTVNTVGTLRSNESVMLRPEVAGRVEQIAFQEGSPVKKSEVLIALDDRLAQAEVSQMEAQLKLAQLSRGRAQKLTQSGAVAQSRLDQATADYGVASANANLARAKLDKTRIHAPFDGVVGLRKVSPGEYVDVGQELASFESLNPMKVNFTIPEVYVPRLKVGQTIDIVIDAFPGRTFAGTVYALDPQVDAADRSVALRANVPNEDQVLKPGFFARVDLQVENKENALLIPESAVVPQGNEATVYVVNAEGKTEVRKITLGLRKDTRVEVTEGLNVGDVVITAGQMKLQQMPPGAAVAAKIAGEEAVAPAAGAVKE